MRYLFALIICSLAVAASAQEVRVSLDLITESGLSPEESRDWLKMLEGLDLSGVRLRSATGGEKIELQKSGSGYRVTGAISADGRLHLPGGKFRKDDRAGVARWLQKLRTGGEEGLTTKTGAFGLLPRQLVEVHDSLAAKVTFSTAGGRPKEVVEKIVAGVPWKVKIDSAAETALGGDETVSEDLIGLSSGTALAAVLRPLGLVLTIDRSERGEPFLRIADSRAVKEHWPIGWPPKKPARETLPDLYKFLNVEVKDTPVGEALEAVRGRLNVPLIVDQNSLARQGINLATTKVTLPKTNTFYSAILERLLFQAKLKYELRVDEADQPFLWVTTQKG
jgi:hypothetical protein